MHSRRVAFVLLLALAILLPVAFISAELVWLDSQNYDAAFQDSTKGVFLFCRVSWCQSCSRAMTPFIQWSKEFSATGSCRGRVIPVFFDITAEGKENEELAFERFPEIPDRYPTFLYYPPAEPGTPKEKRKYKLFEGERSSESWNNFLDKELGCSTQKQ